MDDYYNQELIKIETDLMWKVREMESLDILSPDEFYESQGISLDLLNKLHEKFADVIRAETEINKVYKNILSKVVKLSNVQSDYTEKITHEKLMFKLQDELRGKIADMKFKLDGNFHLKLEEKSHAYNSIDTIKSQMYDVLTELKVANGSNIGHRFLPKDFYN